MVLGLIRGLDFPNVPPTHDFNLGAASYYHPATLHGSSAFIQPVLNGGYTIDGQDHTETILII